MTVKCLYYWLVKFSLAPSVLETCFVEYLTFSNCINDGKLQIIKSNNDNAQLQQTPEGYR